TVRERQMWLRIDAERTDCFPSCHRRADASAMGDTSTDSFWPDRCAAAILEDRGGSEPERDERFTCAKSRSRKFSTPGFDGVLYDCVLIRIERTIEILGADRECDPVWQQISQHD